MKNDKFIKDLTERINGLVENRRDEIMRIEDCIRSARDGIRQAEEEMEKATFESDATTYGKAKDSKESHIVSLEMYERRLAQVKSDELLSESDNIAVDESIVTRQDEIKEETLKKVLPIVNELLEIYNTYREDIKSLDALRSDWRARVWKKKKKIGINSFDLDMPTAYDDGGLSYLLREIRNNNLVVDALGCEKESVNVGINFRD